MSEVFLERWQQGAVALSRRCSEAGPIVVAPADEHRIFVHSSAATWSSCRATGTWHLRRRGDIDIVPAGEEGGYDAAEACEAIEIRLGAYLLERVADDIGRSGEPAGLRALHLARDESMAHLAQALASNRGAGVPPDPLFSESIGIALAVRLLGLAGKTGAAMRGGLSRVQLERVFDFIEAHLDQPLTIDVLAREAGASSSHLRYWFKRAMGVTLHRYVVRQRVARATRLLAQGALSASEVALATGFSHQSHMAHWMRRELGYTPRTLRPPHN